MKLISRVHSKNSFMFSNIQFQYLTWSTGWEQRLLSQHDQPWQHPFSHPSGPVGKSPGHTPSTLGCFLRTAHLSGTFHSQPATLQVEKPQWRWQQWLLIKTKHTLPPDSGVMASHWQFPLSVLCHVSCNRNIPRGRFTSSSKLFVPASSRVRSCVPLGQTLRGNLHLRWLRTMLFPTHAMDWWDEKR